MLKTDRGFINSLQEQYGRMISINLEERTVNNKQLDTTRITTLMLFLDRYNVNYTIVDNNGKIIVYDLDEIE